MLSWSVAETELQIDLRAITDVTIDPLIAGGRQLLDFVTAVLTGEAVAAARENVVAVLGREAAVNAASVIGNFEMMNRIADGVGMPVGQGTRTRMQPIINSLGLDRFPHA